MACAHKGTCTEYVGLYVWSAAGWIRLYVVIRVCGLDFLSLGAVGGLPPARLLGEPGCMLSWKSVLWDCLK